VTSESGASEGRSWLIEPPGPGEITFGVALGEGVEDNAETRAAIEALISTMVKGEVQGYTSVCLLDLGCAALDISCAQVP
jgi:hypothetical protein